jgi:hypothetical protein
MSRFGLLSQAVLIVSLLAVVFTNTLSQTNDRILARKPLAQGSFAPLRLHSAASPTLQTGPLFAPPLVYSTGGYDPMPIAAGDVNGDGKLDIVTANACASYFDWWACC